MKTRFVLFLLLLPVFLVGCDTVDTVTPEDGVFTASGHRLRVTVDGEPAPHRIISVTPHVYATPEEEAAAFRAGLQSRIDLLPENTPEHTRWVGNLESFNEGWAIDSVARLENENNEGAAAFWGECLTSSFLEGEIRNQWVQTAPLRVSELRNVIVMDVRASHRAYTPENTYFMSPIEARHRIEGTPTVNRRLMRPTLDRGNHYSDCSHFYYTWDVVEISSRPGEEACLSVDTWHYIFK